jgi:hypothetical protein
MLKAITAIILVLLVSMAVLADQAAHINQADAIKASAFLKGKKQITHYCAPCGTGINEVIQIKSVESVPANDKDLWEVKVNEEGIDLAYTYFLTDSGKWKNLAIEMGIKVVDVPEFLPEKKPGG